jgi:hypothetical protein
MGEGKNKDRPMDKDMSRNKKTTIDRTSYGLGKVKACQITHKKEMSKGER